MVSFIFRFVIISFLGMLLDPGQLAHRLPTQAQISRFEHDVRQNDGLRRMVATRISGIHRDMLQISKTVKELRVAYTDIRTQLAEDQKTSHRSATSDE